MNKDKPSLFTVLTLLPKQPTTSLGRLGFRWAALLLTKLNQPELKA